MSLCSLLQCLQVQTKELEGGHKLTFMKFTFQSPALEIKAPVLNDKTVGYQVIQRFQEEPSNYSFCLAGAPTERCLCVPQSNLQYSSWCCSPKIAVKCDPKHQKRKWPIEKRSFQFFLLIFLKIKIYEPPFSILTDPKL